MVYTIDMLIEKIESLDKSYDIEKIKAAYELADKAHEGVVRTSGDPYISHPVAVAYILVEKFSMDTDTICAALLHDVVEDSSYTIDDLRMHGFSEEILEAVRLLTHDKDIPYVYYILAIKDNDIARSVKIADLLHNSDLSRLEKVTPEDEVRCRKYNTAMHLLSQNFNSEEFLYSY